jgi:hypothetical protein
VTFAPIAAYALSARSRATALREFCQGAVTGKDKGRVRCKEFGGFEGFKEFGGFGEFREFGGSSQFFQAVELPCIAGTA